MQCVNEFVMVSHAMHGQLRLRDTRARAVRNVLGLDATSRATALISYCYSVHCNFW